MRGRKPMSNCQLSAILKTVNILLLLVAAALPQEPAPLVKPIPDTASLNARQRAAWTMKCREAPQGKSPAELFRRLP